MTTWTEHTINSATRYLKLVSVSAPKEILENEKGLMEKYLLNAVLKEKVNSEFIDIICKISE